MKKIAFSFCTALALILVSGSSFAQKSTIDLTTPIAVDPDVRTGKLENGLVYYIRQNKKPENRVELRLAVNAGSILENDDQQGLAHFTEHMCFNGTKSFPKNELISFLQKTGVQFGADINAYTGFDETVYMLQLPTDDSVLVKTGIQVLEEWAHSVTFDGKEIDKERGVIIEEWRLGLGAQDRMMKKFLPVILKGSKYAERVPIGKIEILENFDHETLRTFYHDWYRPDLMAVVVTGDIDPAWAEALVIKHFSTLRNPDQERERIVYDLPGNDRPLVAVTTDPEAPQNVLLVFYKHPLLPVTNLGDLKEELKAELFTGMLNQRFSELRQKPECPFVYANGGYGKFLTRTRDSYILTAMPKENQIDKTLELILQENERIRQYGFTETEFVRQKEDMVSRYEKSAREFDKQESATLAGEYVDHFLNKTPIPGVAKKFKYVQKLLPEITLDEVNALAEKWVTGDNMAMVVMAPDKEGVAVPDSSAILDVIDASGSLTLDPWIDKFKEAPLIPTELPGGTITRRTENSELGFTEIILSNGVRVILKPTTFKNDEILISAYSPGGNSLYDDDLFMSANNASRIIDQSGAGEFDKVELDKKLKGKNLSIAPFIDDVKEGFRGNAAPKDFGTLLELVWLYFNAPRYDTTAFSAFISQMENQMKFMMGNPLMAFYDTVFKTAYPANKRIVIFPSGEQIRSIRMDDAFKIYTDRFADAGDFTFIVVGSFSLDSIPASDSSQLIMAKKDTVIDYQGEKITLKEGGLIAGLQPNTKMNPPEIFHLIEKYLGSLPATGRNETWLDKSPDFATATTDIVFHKGADPQSMVALLMSEGFDWNEKSLMELAMLREILTIKLVEVIREDLSGVYSPQVLLNSDQYPVPEYMLGVIFGCSPKTTEKLTKAVLSEMKKLRKNGPTPEDLAKVKEILIRNRETNMEKNEFWLAKLESLYFNHDDPRTFLNYTERVNAMTISDIKDAANRYLNINHYVRVVLMPELK